MSTLLQLDASANDSEESVTRALTRAFATAWLTAGPDRVITRRDLVRGRVPSIGRAYCALGRRLEREGVVPVERVADHVSGEQEALEWACTRPLIDELRSADAVVVGAPIYNFGVSASLKAWIDRVTFPGAFTNGALHRTPIVIVTASGGAYGPGEQRHGRDFQTPNLRRWWQSIGARDVEFVSVELCLSGLVPRLSPWRSQHETSLAAARAQVLQLACIPR